MGPYPCFTVSRILAPVAFSAPCQGSLEYAEALACRFHSELVLLHVVAPIQSYALPEAMALAPEVMDKALDYARNRLSQYVARAPKGLSVKREILEGDPATEIVRYAREGNFGLIVMPTHGYGPFRRFLLGSVTAKVLHDAPCAVWTGPHLEDAPKFSSITFSKVLCAIDLGSHSRAVVEWGAGFAGEYGAALTVTHAIPGSAVFAGRIYFDPEWLAQVKNHARDEIISLLKDLQVEAEVEISVGEPPEAVRAVAEQSAAGLLVIGRGGAHGLLGRLRANAYGILRESPCPVVAV